jgi:hypothetical protein
MRGKRTLSVYEELKYSWGREAYASCCSMKEKSGVAYFRLGIWKLKEAWKVGWHGEG